MSCWVFVVDDDALNLKFAEKMLKDSGMRVTTAPSGLELLSFLSENAEQPDVILLDILMPDMDGFETYRKLREMEEEDGREEIPVVFLTGGTDVNLEKEGLGLGAADFMRKPFLKDVLLQRIDNIISNSKTIRGLTEEAERDPLTGFLNKPHVEKRLKKLLRHETGALMVLDLDSFKLVNDIHGHEMGDKVLQAFAELVRRTTRSEDILGRVGGDEFIAFYQNATSEKSVDKLVERMNIQLRNESRKLMGDDFEIPIGVSAGVVFVPEQGTDYQELFRMADKALYNVKQNGRHGYAVFNYDADHADADDQGYEEDMLRLTQIMEERYITNSALWLGQGAFINIYRFLFRFIQSYHGVAYKALFTLLPRNVDYNGATIREITDEFGKLLKSTLRKSDLLMQSRSNQFFVLLPELSDEYVDNVVKRILGLWEKRGHADAVEVVYELEIIDGRVEDDGERRRKEQE